jgi:DNA repair exonuclease SbcCD ATPase subunit
MPDYLVSPIAAAQAAGIAKSSIRNYVTNPLYSGMFSGSALQTPRQFTTDDVRLLRFIGTQTHAGRDHEAVAAMIRAGALAQDDWQPPQVTTQAAQPQQAEDAQQQPGAALVLASAIAGELAQYRTTTAGLTGALFEASRNLARAEARIKSLEDELQYLRQQADNAAIVARLEAELADVRRPVGLLARLLGYR